jgi:putative ATP-binding cassette transporter
VEMYKPSLDWSDEVPASLLWSAKAWVIAAAVTVVLLILLARYTVWGRQFWRITGGYFRGRESVLVWAWLGVLLFSVMISVRLQVLLSYFSNDLYSSLQTAFEGAGAGNEAVKQSGVDGFKQAILTFVVIAAVYIASMLIDVYLTQRFIIRWRVWLNNRLIGDWLDGEAFYRVRFLDNPVDNPDQRIQLDIDAFTAVTGSGVNTPDVGTMTTLPFGAIYSVVNVVAFTPILWNLAGPLTLFGVTIPHALFWIALAYVFATTVVAFWIGRPLIRFSFRNERTNAAFRYALVRLRDAAEAVSLYRGERAERSILRERFGEIITNYRRYVVRSLVFLGWNQTASQAINPLPLVVQSQELFKGNLTFGDVTQSASAFSNVHDSLAFFRSAYDSFASYRATIIRLDGLVRADAQARALPRLHIEPSPYALELTDLEIHATTGRLLLDKLTLRLEPGESLVITGPSGCGRTTLLRSLAGLWPYASGTLRRPGDESDAMFLSQVPYMPLGDLRAVLSYPNPEAELPDEQLIAALNEVALGHLTGSLNETADWSKTLSPGEQQRIAFARILLHKPARIYLDESTAALDEGNEYALYRLIRTRLPRSIIVSVTHRNTVKQHHLHHLRLIGDGRWELERQGEPAGV